MPVGVMSNSAKTMPINAPETPSLSPAKIIFFADGSITKTIVANREARKLFDISNSDGFVA